MALFRATVDWSFPIGSGGGTNSWALRTLTDDGTTTEVAALMNLVKTFYTATLASYPNTTTISWDGLVSQLATPTPQLLEAATPWSLTGSGSGTAYEAAPVMACVTWRSSLASRRGRGRTFLGPLVNGAIDADGTLNPGAVTSFRTAASDLVSASLSDTNGAVVVFSELDQVGRDFIASSVTDQAAVLRSRR